MRDPIVLIFAGAFILLTTILTGCRTKEDTIAIICVQYSNNAPVANAQVTIYGSGTEGVVTVNKEAETNSAGEAIFNFNDEYQLG